MRVDANGIFLECETCGPAGGNPLVLIRGLGTQLIHWPKELVAGFASRGFRTILFDNRDAGLSRRCPAPGVGGNAAEILARLARGETPEVAYTLADMARDTVGLMDALGIEKAHIFGMSMGGAIAQVLAIEHAERLLGATIIMSAARFRLDGLAERLFVEPQTRDEYQSAWVDGVREWGGSRFPVDENRLRDEAARAWDRGYDADAVNRQALATILSGDRRKALRSVRLPCRVVHGTDDTLAPLAAGSEVADAIPDAEFEIIPGMGHYIAPALVPLILDGTESWIRQ